MYSGLITRSRTKPRTRRGFENVNRSESNSVLPKSIEPIATILGPGQAVRPKFSVLDTSRYRELTGESIRDWKLALQDFLRPGTGP